MSDVKQINEHSLKYESGRIFVTGVVNVDSFDEKEVELRLATSSLTLKGSGFKLDEMEVKSGILSLQGKLSSLNYHEKAEKMGLVKRLFK